MAVARRRDRVGAAVAGGCARPGDAGGRGLSAGPVRAVRRLPPRRSPGRVSRRRRRNPDRAGGVALGLLDDRVRAARAGKCRPVWRHERRRRNPGDIRPDVAGLSRQPARRRHRRCRRVGARAARQLEPVAAGARDQPVGLPDTARSRRPILHRFRRVRRAARGRRLHHAAAGRAARAAGRRCRPRHPS